MRRLLVAAVTVLSAACGLDSSPPAVAARTSAACAGTVGVTCVGTRGWVEYIPGDLPIVISVPHGGSLTPDDVPDRTSGVTTQDRNTIEFGRAIVEAFVTQSGRAPHLVLMHLRRTKLDANRELAEAAQGSEDASVAWAEYHAFIERAATRVRQSPGSGLYLDLHGHGHAIERLELGYLLSAGRLNDSDADLDADGALAQSSLRLLLPRSSLTASALLRGPTSFGGLLAPELAAVPSPSMPGPGEADYFSGGYSTVRYSSILPAIQIESPLPGVRDTAEHRSRAARVLVRAISDFVATHLGRAEGLPRVSLPRP